MGIFGIGKGKTLYYSGCLARDVLSEQFENYKEIFDKLGVNYILSDKEICCGIPVLNAGYKKEARKIAKKNFDLFKKNNVDKIIVSCPSCYYMFKEVYPKLVRDWDIEVEHATIVILNALKKKRIRFRDLDEDREIVAYHDSCYLGRHSGIYEEPREVIELLGGKILEMKNNRENSICCGGGVSANFPELAKNSAKLKVKEISGDVSKIISPCGSCYLNIKSVSDKSVEFSSFVLGKLRGIK